MMCGNTVNKDVSLAFAHMPAGTKKVGKVPFWVHWLTSYHISSLRLTAMLTRMQSLGT